MVRLSVIDELVAQALRDHVESHGPCSFTGAELIRDHPELNGHHRMAITSSLKRLMQHPVITEYNVSFRCCDRELSSDRNYHNVYYVTQWNTHN